MQAVIFDCDGLLLETESMYTKSFQSVLGRYDKVFDMKIKARCMGKKATEVAEMIAAEMCIPLTAEQFNAEITRLNHEIFPYCTIHSGVERLVRHLKAHGVKIAVASGSSTDAFKLKTMRHSYLFSLFDAIVLGDDVARGKPSPDLFLRAAELLQVDPKQCIVFEDAPNGVEAALAAGMTAIWIPKFDHSIAFDCGRVHVLQSIADFAPHKFGLPPFDE